MFKVEFDTANDAFLIDPVCEIRTVLDKVINAMYALPADTENASGKVFDSFGNSVGSWEYEAE